MSTDTAAIIKAQQEAAEQVWLEEYLAGPQHTRLEAVPPQVGDEAPDLELPDSSGSPRRLSEFWADRPVHLVFLRHFGCGCLADRWEQLAPAQEKISAAGATLVAVCQADPERAADVAKRRGYEFPLLCDPSLAAYRAYGLPDGEVAAVFHDDPWKPNDHEAAARLTDSRRGTERALMDHSWQLPGEFVIAQGGRLVLTHRAQHCEDFPPTGVLLGAIAASRT